MSLEKPLGYLLGQTMRIYKNKLLSRLKEVNTEINFEEFLLLLQLNERDNLTQQDLANHLQKDKSIILRQINTLIEKRFVVRLPDREDKRKKNLIMTQKGHESLLFAKEIGKNLSDELLLGLNTEDLQTFQKVLEKIWENGGFDEDQCCC